ncbi:MAG TPA: class I SAM-dependent methyltransferase [Candidatus Bathyarchaeia archaeon]|nr:class I SAM-dependent methyltransferase [Candidatus Bathyarchaeia archaeon]
MSQTTLLTTRNHPDSMDYSEFLPLLGNRARPEPRWIEALTGVGSDEVAHVLDEMRDNLARERTIRDTMIETGRTYYAQFPAPLELYGITRILNPDHIVESGVSSGISSAHFLLALKRNRKGTLHSIDYPTYSSKPKRSKADISWTIPYGRDSGWAVPIDLRKRWDLRKGRSEELLEDLLGKIKTVDIFCHDSPWTSKHLEYELKTVQPHLRSGSIVIADNSSYNPNAVEKLAAAFSARVFHRRGSDLIGIRVP